MAVIIDAKATLAAMRAMVVRQEAATRSGLAKGAHLLERDIKASLSVTDTSGDERRDSKGRFAKRATGSSAPGEPPHLQSGDLRRSIQVEGPEPRAGGGYEATVGPTIVYGRIQELGGVAGRGAVLPARPYVEPALERMTPVIAVVMRDAWRAALRG